MRKGYASLSAELVTLGRTMRPTQIVGPDGDLIRVLVPVEGALPVEDCCPHCGATKPVDNFTALA
jgi:hypothetical protein